MKNIYNFFLIVIFFSNSLISQELFEQDKNNEPRTILFIGNSYLYYGDSLHNHFKRMAEEYLEDYDGSASVKSATIGGSRLKHHDVERLIMPKAISSIEKFDLVILQGGSSEPLTQENRKALDLISLLDELEVLSYQQRLRSVRGDTVERPARFCCAALHSTERH